MAPMIQPVRTSPKKCLPTNTRLMPTIIAQKRIIVVVTSGIVPESYPGAYCKAHGIGCMGAEEAVNVFLINWLQEVHAAACHFGVNIGALPLDQELDEGGKLVQAGEGARTGQHHYQALFPTQSIDKESYDYQIHRYPYQLIGEGLPNKICYRTMQRINCRRQILIQFNYHIPIFCKDTKNTVLEYCPDNLPLRSIPLIVR